MKLITEDIETVDTLIEEGTNGSKSYTISGPFMQAEVKNRNGRLYPKHILEAQVAKYMSMVNENRAMGELNHPSSPNVNPVNASHLITELRWEGNDVVGKARILNEDFPMAKIARGMIKEGIKFGVSTRGMGTVRKRSDGINEVNKDFRLICVDIVSDPSGPECFVNGIMEQAEWVLNPITGLYEAQIEQIRNEVKSTPRLTLEQKTALMNKFFKLLS
jgi:hypothetical protein